MLHARRRPRAARILATLLLGLLTACAPDAVDVGGTVAVTAILQGPSDVSAVVMDIAGVSSVEVVGGDGFTRTTASGLRTVAFPYEPGPLELRLEPDGSDAPSVTVVQVADASGEVVPTDQYLVEIDG